MTQTTHFERLILLGKLKEAKGEILKTEDSITKDYWLAIFYAMANRTDKTLEIMKNSVTSNLTEYQQFLYVLVKAITQINALKRTTGQITPEDIEFLKNYDKNSAIANVMIGYYYWSTDNANEAYRFFKKGSTIIPENETIKKRMVLMLFDQKKYKEALLEVKGTKPTFRRSVDLFAISIIHNVVVRLVVGFILTTTTFACRFPYNLIIFGCLGLSVLLSIRFKDEITYRVFFILSLFEVAFIIIDIILIILHILP